MNLYQSIFSALNKANVKYLIVGGVAVNLHGYNRFTGDIDILLALDAKNLIRMQKIMEELNYIPRQPVGLHELGDKKKLQLFLKEKGMKAYTFVPNSGHPQLAIDILAEGSLAFRKMYTQRVTIEVWGLSLPVVCLTDLIGMKKEANRAKDLLDLQALLHLKSL